MSIGTAGQVLHHGAGRFVSYVEDGDRGTPSRELAGDRLTHPGRAAGHDRRTTFEFSHHGLSFFECAGIARPTGANCSA